jgi:hypothetical protein
VPLEGLGVGQLAPVAVHRQQRRPILRHLTDNCSCTDARSARIQRRISFNIPDSYIILTVPVNPNYGFGSYLDIFLSIPVLQYWLAKTSNLIAELNFFLKFF